LATTAGRLFSALLIWRLQERLEERHEVMGDGRRRVVQGLRRYAIMQSRKSFHVRDQKTMKGFSSGCFVCARGDDSI
jgi:hypothetical protein